MSGPRFRDVVTAPRGRAVLVADRNAPALGRSSNHPAGLFATFFAAVVTSSKSSPIASFSGCGSALIVVMRVAFLATFVPAADAVLSLLAGR